VKRPLLAALAAVLAALALLFGFSAWLFSRNLEEARRISQQRMTALARYVAEQLQAEAGAGAAFLPDGRAGELGRWLAGLARATGLERAVIADSSGRVHSSGHPLIAGGDDLRPYLVDTALFAAAAGDGAPRFTPLAEIAGVRFQSLYHPFPLEGRRHVVVLESDQNFLASVEQFRAYLALASLFLLGVFAVLGAGLLALDRKVQAALAESRRNERLAFLGRASAELAHEIRNPLGIIKSSVDVLRRRFDPDREHKPFDFVSDEVMRLSRLISNILGLSRDRPVESKPFFPREVLEGLRDALAQELPGVQWALETPADLAITGDRDLFRQVADNLARNAAAAMGGRGRFRVAAERLPGAGIRFLFEDAGPGLPAHVRARLFEPFVSGSKAGTGLGLSIVRNLCERAGWRVSLLSDAAAGRGPTRFAVDVPGAPAAAAGEGGGG
jgi:signal transduction histidine kinase